MVGTRGVEENRAASPVIAVVLLVAITVLLASTAGYVVFGMADETKETAPQTAITATYDRNAANGEAVDLVFEGGDTLEEKNVYFVLQGAEKDGVSDPVEIKNNQIDDQIGSEITAGDTMRIGASETTQGDSNDLDLNGATLRLVWDPASADIQESETIWRWSPE